MAGEGVVGVGVVVGIGLVGGVVVMVDVGVGVDVEDGNVEQAAIKIVDTAPIKSANSIKLPLRIFMLSIKYNGYSPFWLLSSG